MRAWVTPVRPDETVAGTVPMSLSGRLALPARGALLLAAAFALLPLGFVWSVGTGIDTTGYYLPGYCYLTEDYCDPDTYIPGIHVPGSVATVSQSPIRVFVVGAAVMLLVAAGANTARIRRRWTGLAIACLAVAIALSLARTIIVVVLLGIALALAVAARRPSGTAPGVSAPS